MAGATKNIARPRERTDKEFALRQVRISVELHRIEKVIVMNHTDCGAYGGRGSDEDSEWQHIEDMKTAKDAILDMFDPPNLAVNLALARIDEYNNVQIVEIPG
jgi:carbonic anhydrase